MKRPQLECSGCEVRNLASSLEVTNDDGLCHRSRRGERDRGHGCMITADGAYAARLARGAATSWFPERWTLDGPEPYAVPLPGNQPEEPGTRGAAAGGRAGAHPPAWRTGGTRSRCSIRPGPGPVNCRWARSNAGRGTELRLLPPAPGGDRAYALAAGPELHHRCGWWRAAPSGPSGSPRCRGAARAGSGWTATGRLLALDRERTGRTKTVVVDLERGGEVSPLLQITEDSDDRLLLADADSGLLLIRSDAPAGPGAARLGRAGQHAARCASRSALRLGGRAADAVRHPAGADADAGELRGGAADRAAALTGRSRRRGRLARACGGPLSGGSTNCPRPRVVGGGWAVDPGRGAATAVRDGGGAVRGVAGGGACGGGGRGVVGLASGGGGGGGGGGGATPSPPSPRMSRAPRSPGGVHRTEALECLCRAAVGAGGSHRAGGCRRSDRRVAPTTSHRPEERLLDSPAFQRRILSTG